MDVGHRYSANFIHKSVWRDCFYHTFVEYLDIWVQMSLLRSPNSADCCSNANSDKLWNIMIIFICVVMVDFSPLDGELCHLSPLLAEERNVTKIVSSSF